jgi:SAM-dependent methyltransferase
VKRVDVPCRSCEERPLVSVLDLGTTPLANALLTREALAQEEERFPLELAFCEGCSLVQITEAVPPQKLFGEYVYFSSFSDTMLKHSEAIATRLARERKLGSSSLVVEVASNDGYLLQYYARAGIPVLGIEPAANIARVAEGERGIPTLCAFFGDELGARLVREGKRADVLHGNNVLAHVPDLNGFVAGIARVLKDDGLAVIEAPHVRDVIEHVEFDTIYHEHLCYFSLTALDRLFARHGLAIVDVEHLAIHGGSLRIFASPSPASHAAGAARHEFGRSHGTGAPRGAAVTTMLEAEKEQGVTALRYYDAFAGNVRRLGESLTGLLRDLRGKGKRIAAYGASAKGSTLLNTFGIGADLVDFVVDRSSHKQGRYTPGTHLLIEPPARLLEAMPDYVLLLTWNFADEILAQQAEYRMRGGRFIVPVPEVKVV